MPRLPLSPRHICLSTLHHVMRLEPADVEPLPLGATFTGTVTGNTVTSSAGVTVVMSNPMGDDPIKVVSGMPSLSGVLWSRNSRVIPQKS
jgi:hypothetical protein